MIFNYDIHHRKSIRLSGYDYAQAGCYFVTICACQRMPLFGSVVDGEMVPNEIGKIAEQSWRNIPQHFPQVILDEFVVMPNHVHGIITINGFKTVGANNHLPLRKSGTSRTLGSIVRGFKIGVTKEVRASSDLYVVWQRNYYERIIRNDAELHDTRKYIQDNPLQWALDDLHVP